MKHGMLTVRSKTGGQSGHETPGGHDTQSENDNYDDHGERPRTVTVVAVILITFGFLAGGLWLSGAFFG